MKTPSRFISRYMEIDSIGKCVGNDKLEAPVLGVVRKTVVTLLPIDKRRILVE